jgi:hypothetical protein
MNVMNYKNVKCFVNSVCSVVGSTRQSLQLNFNAAPPEVPKGGVLASMGHPTQM